MKLTVLNSNSRGNCYILQNDQEAMILECGVRLSAVKKVLGFNVSKVVACLVTHEHGDHSKYINDFLDTAIPVYASPGTINSLKLKSTFRPTEVLPRIQYEFGGFKVIPFDVKHDCAQPLGFQISHPETGTILFVTDSYYIPYTFQGLSHILIECNYSSDILNENYQTGKIVRKVKDRVIESHMSLDTCRSALQANDLSQVRNIILLHLSDNNSDERRFLKEIKEATGKRVFIAQKGFEIELNKNLF